MKTHKRGRRQFGSLLSPVVSIVHNNVFWFSSFQENVCLYSRIILPDTLQNQRVNLLKMDIVGGLKAPASDRDSNQGFQFIKSAWYFFSRLNLVWWSRYENLPRIRREANILWLSFIRQFLWASYNFSLLKISTFVVCLTSKLSSWFLCYQEYTQKSPLVICGSLYWIENVWLGA